MLNFGKIQEILGKDGDSLIGFKNPKVSKDSLHLPGSDFIARIEQSRFCIVLPETDYFGSILAMRRLRRSASTRRSAEISSSIKGPA